MWLRQPYCAHGGLLQPRQVPGRCDAVQGAERPGRRCRRHGRRRGRGRACRVAAGAAGTKRQGQQHWGGGWVARQGGGGGWGGGRGAGRGLQGWDGGRGARLGLAGWGVGWVQGPVGITIWAHTSRPTASAGLLGASGGEEAAPAPSPVTGELAVSRARPPARPPGVKGRPLLWRRAPHRRPHSSSDNPCWGGQRRRQRRLRRRRRPPAGASRRRRCARWGDLGGWWGWCGWRGAWAARTSLGCRLVTSTRWWVRLGRRAGGLLPSVCTGA
jgi:hypothetical protein